MKRIRLYEFQYPVLGPVLTVLNSLKSRRVATDVAIFSNSIGNVPRLKTF
jgi:hypothetical protein